MLNRDELLALADEAAGVLKRLRSRLAADNCNPTPITTAQTYVGLAAVASKLAKLDRAVKDDGESKKKG